MDKDNKELRAFDEHVKASLEAATIKPPYDMWSRISDALDKEVQIESPQRTISIQRKVTTKKNYSWVYAASFALMLSIGVSAWIQIGNSDTQLAEVNLFLPEISSTQYLAVTDHVATAKTQPQEKVAATEAEVINPVDFRHNDVAENTVAENDVPSEFETKSMPVYSLNFRKSSKLIGDKITILEGDVKYVEIDKEANLKSLYILERIRLEEMKARNGLNQ